MPDAAASRGVRTALRTFLIADVRGYTSFTQSRGDEAAGRLAATFADVAQRVVEAAGGRVQELRGDEALCVFTSPRQALRAAIEMQQQFVDLTLEDPDFPYGVGIGIDTGEAVRVKGGYRGGALNLAARLCSLAKAGEVLASREAIHLAGPIDGVRYDERPPAVFKGIERPTPVIQLVPHHNPAANPAFLAAVRPRHAHALAERRRQRRQFIAVAAAIVVLLIADIGVAVSRAGNLKALPDVGTNALGVIDTGQDVLYSRVPMALSAPGPMTADGGTVWATNTDTATLLAVDTSHHAVANTIAVGRDPTGLAVGSGAVWVSAGSSRQVDRVDRASDRVVDQITVGNGPTAVAVGAGSVWVANRLDGTVSVIDPRKDTVSATIPVGSEPSALLVAAGAVWVANAGSATVVRIDPVTRQVVATIPVGDLPSALAYADGGVWVANTLDGTVSRIASTDNAVSATVSTGGEPTSIATDGSDVWVADGLHDDVTHVRGNHVVRVIPVGNSPVSLAFAGGRLYVAATGSAIAHRGGTLHVVNTFDGVLTLNPQYWPSLDPSVAYRQLTWALMKDVFDGLVTVQHVGGPGGALVVPDLARAMPSISDGGRTYTFQLRSGIRFSDGTTMHASDFRRSFIRMLRAPSGGHDYYTSVVGAQACIDHGSCAGVSRGIVVDDASGSVTIHLTQPDPELLYQLALPFASVVGPASPSGVASKGPVMGTGPYVLDAHPPKDHVVLRRNRFFHVWSAAARPDGYPDVIDVTLVNDLTDAVLTQTTKGRYDDAGEVDSSSAIQRLQRSVATQLQPAPQLLTRYYFLSTQHGVFRSVLARRAVNYALDRRQAVASYGGAFFETPTCQVLPPSLYGYQPYCPYTARPDRSGIWKGPDLAKARQLVAQSGTKGATVSVAIRPDTPQVENALLAALRQLGYHVRLITFRAKDPNTAFTNYFNYVATASNRADAGVDGWISDYPAPSNFLQQLLTCGSINHTPAKNLNDSLFCNRGVDVEVERALGLQTTDPAAAGQQWAAIDRAITDQAPWAPFGNGRQWDVVSPRVGNFQSNPMLGTILDQMWVR
jgi:peptide/nickel transport system substrate-binding protein